MNSSLLAMNLSLLAYNRQMALHRVPDNVGYYIGIEIWIWGLELGLGPRLVLGPRLGPFGPLSHQSHDFGNSNINGIDR